MDSAAFLNKWMRFSFLTGWSTARSWRYANESKVIRTFEKLEHSLHGLPFAGWNSAAHQSASLYAVGESGKTPDRWTPFVDVTQSCCQLSLRVRFLIALLLERFVMLHASRPIRFLPHSVADSLERSTAKWIKFQNISRPVNGFECNLQLWLSIFLTPLLQRSLQCHSL